MEERVAIFIDGSNLYHALKDNFGRADLNFAEFARKLCGERALFRTYYYNVLQEPGKVGEGHRDQGDFLDALRRVPYFETRLGGTKLSQGVAVEKGIDIMLAADLVNFAWKNVYDTAILVSGDADFAYAVRVVKDMGKHVEVAHFESNVSRDLMDLADCRHLLSRDFFKGLWAVGPVARRRRPHRRGGPPRQMGIETGGQAPPPIEEPAPVPSPVPAAESTSPEW
ncbi:MAG: NYN domain-containing protein [Chloroflexota bacterium]